MRLITKGAKRSDILKFAKPEIDAANKRLKRAGSSEKISMRGLNNEGLLEAVKRAQAVPTAERPRLKFH